MFGPRKTKINTDEKRINEVLNRGIVVEILPTKEDFVKQLTSGDRLKIYIGADPTSGSLHLSHAKNYMFLEELRQLGHEVIILVGDFTAQIGDPSDRGATRKTLSEEQVKENVKGWISQIKPLMNFDDKENPPRIVYNNQWLSKLSFKEVVSLASNFTVQQILERDMFEKRLKENKPIYLHEFLYPLMQGYDSVELEVDAELCGTDQIFNALTGRTLLKRIKNKDKFVIVVNLMANPKTGELMSKSRGTGVFLSSVPNEMYGAIMSQPDEMTEILFINCTRISLADKEKVFALGPMAAKARIAFEIVKTLHGEKNAKLAEEHFNDTFKFGNLPENIKEVKAEMGELLMDIVLWEKLVSSKSDFRRLVSEGAVSNAETKEKITDPFFKITSNLTIRIGPLRFLKIKI